jgi:predicted anti-sigma-YlaC factor YlaD
VATEIATQRADDEEDLGLAREASAFYLKFSESLLKSVPDNLPLSVSVSAGYTQYAYAFVQFEADRLESRDAKAAQKLRDRARLLYLRAHRHAMLALERMSPGFARKLASPIQAEWPELLADQVEISYWAAASWGGLIALSKDDPDTVADFPLAMRLATLVWKKQPEFGAGSIAGLMGTFESARPGGTASKAGFYFDRAIALSEGKSASSYVAKAEGFALPAGDRASFEELLRKAISISALERNLTNSAMRERAMWLLDSADDLF